MTTDAPAPLSGRARKRDAMLVNQQAAAELVALVAPGDWVRLHAAAEHWLSPAAPRNSARSAARCPRVTSAGTCSSAEPRPRRGSRFGAATAS